MITIKFFASLKTIAEMEEKIIEVSNSISMDQLSEIISKTSPKMGEFIREKKVMISVNQEMADSETIIHDGDEVAFLPPFSGGSYNKEVNIMSTTTDSKVRIQLENFSVTDEIEVMKKVSRNIGGITTFLGTGRELSKGENITQLNFEHYPKMAEKKLEEIRLKAIKDYGIIDMSIIHRIGPIEIGENIVLIVAVGEHRKETFIACEWAIAELKRTTPIWKRETTSTGEVWVQDTP